MTALAFAAPPEPRVIATSMVPCETCRRRGHLDDSTVCSDCNGSGAQLVEIVACPVHDARVARAASGGLLGTCDGCAAETARALRLLPSIKTTGPADFPLEKLVDGARQETL